MTGELATRRKDWVETRQLILETFARMIVEDGVRDVSIQQVADRAGIAHRTVYRHFSTRQDLVEELAEWLADRDPESGNVTNVHDVDDIPAAVIESARSFDRRADLITALVIATWESGTVSRIQQQRTEELEKLLSPFTAHLEPDQARCLIALLRYIGSSRFWYLLREEHGLTGDVSGPVVAWVFQVLLDALRDPADPGPGGVGRKDQNDDQ